MIKSIRIRDFRCFNSVQTGLRPLTVLIGPNDSGKSSFLEAIRSVLQPTVEFGENDFPNRDRSKQPTIEITTDAGKVSKSFDPKGGGKPRTTTESGALESVTPFLFVQLPNSGMRLSGNIGPDSDRAPTVESNGGGIAAVLDYLARRDRDRLFEIEAAMKRQIANFRSLEILRSSANECTIKFRYKDGTLQPDTALSAGARFLLFFATLATQPNPPKLLLIEEPETGVHPHRLSEIMKFMHSLISPPNSAGATQVILSTHSPYLLDYVDVANDQVLVFRNAESGNRTVTPADVDELKFHLSDFKLGELWFNLREEGMVKAEGA
ncbi:MAG: AAA family ATPase [Phycisphaerales bacterium]|nr:AAA family ATPase [Phycisphaerales bacterium]